MVFRTTRITIETESLTIVRHVKAASAWCPECQAEVDVISLPATSLSDPETAPQMNALINNRGVHVWDSPQGNVHICMFSLLRSSTSPEELDRVPQH